MHARIIPYNRQRPLSEHTAPFIIRSYLTHAARCSLNYIHTSGKQGTPQMRPVSLWVYEAMYCTNPLTN